MYRISNSWELIKASWRVLLADKELMIFPILSSIGVLLVTATFAIPLFAGNFFQSLSDGGRFIYYIVLFQYYIVQYFVIFFANTALVGAAMIRIKGGDPTVRDGFDIAFKRFGSILGYALIAATVGVLLSMLRNSKKRSGGRDLVASLIGFAWTVATFLVVPILAIENVGPIEAIKRSVMYLKKTWGEQIVGNFGVSLVFNIITAVVIVLFVGFFLLAAYLEAGAAIFILLGILLVLLLLAIGLVSSTLSGIFSAAVYQYASTGQAGQFFDQKMVADSFTAP